MYEMCTFTPCEISTITYICMSECINLCTFLWIIINISYKNTFNDFPEQF